MGVDTLVPQGDFRVYRDTRRIRPPRLEKATFNGGRNLSAEARNAERVRQWHKEHDKILVDRRTMELHVPDHLWERFRRDTRAFLRSALG